MLRSRYASTDVTPDSRARAATLVGTGAPADRPPDIKLAAKLVCGRHGIQTLEFSVT